MTEEEAKTKWCPFARVVGMHTKNAKTTALVANRASEGLSPNLTVEERQNPPTARCIASACMAWRTIRERRYAPGEQFHESDLKDGFCGLAGAP